MRLVALAMILVASAGEAEPDFLTRLRAAGPQALRTADNLGPPSRTPNARLETTADGALLLTWTRIDGVPRHFRFHPGDNPLEADAAKVGELASDCRGGGAADRYEVSCWMPSDRHARNLRGATIIYRFEFREDGIRALRTDVRGRDRLVFSPPTATARPPRGVPEGAPAALADALRQLAAHEKGGLGGGSSGGGDWYASDLWVTQVRGLDFKLERTVWSGRGGRSHLVPARWSFDYQGPAGGEPQSPAWLMLKDGREEFWCVGQPRRSTVEIFCRQGRRPWKPGADAKPAFTLAPFPKWMIYVEEGRHSLFSSVGTSRLEPLAYP